MHWKDVASSTFALIRNCTPPRFSDPAVAIQSSLRAAEIHAGSVKKAVRQALWHGRYDDQVGIYLDSALRFALEDAPCVGNHISAGESRGLLVAGTRNAEERFRQLRLNAPSIPDAIASDLAMREMLHYWLLQVEDAVVAKPRVFWKSRASSIVAVRDELERHRPQIEKCVRSLYADLHSDVPRCEAWTAISTVLQKCHGVNNATAESLLVQAEGAARQALWDCAKALIEESPLEEGDVVKIPRVVVVAYGYAAFRDSLLDNVTYRSLPIR